MIKLQKLLKEVAASGDYLEAGAENDVRFGNKIYTPRRQEQEYCNECGSPMYEEKMCNECGWMEEGLKGGQKKLDVAPPFGKITGADFKKLRSKKHVKKEVDTPNPPTDYSGKPSIKGLMPIVEEDHEVFMALKSLKEIQSAAQSLMAKLGEDEKDIPAWIQDHITNAENYIKQANEGFYIEDQY